MRTKALELYGTLGPACARENILEGMFRAGMTGMRVNLSHMTLDQARPWIEIMHRAAARCGLEPDLLADLQGPEVRVGKLPAPLALKTGETVARDALHLPLPLREMLAPGQEILLDDGKLLLETLDRDRAKILRGGTLLPRKSAAVPGQTLTLPPLTPEDEDNLRRAEELGVTGVMQSFVRGREDVLALRSALCRCGCKGIRLYAKVENRLGLETLPQWIDLADCIVIARGDLGNAIPLTRLPAAQKAIAGLAKERGKPFLVVDPASGLHGAQRRPHPGGGERHLQCGFGRGFRPHAHRRDRRRRFSPGGHGGALPHRPGGLERPRTQRRNELWIILK